jgi:diguanylate cyclase (GGDEF)-like protein
MEDEVRRAFLNRPHLVESTSGFRGIEILNDATDPSIFLLVTRWTDEHSFRVWYHSEAHHSSHSLIPKGLKLDPAFTSVTVGNEFHSPAEFENLFDAATGCSGAIFQWLLDSDAIFALLLAPGGHIRARNRAAQRLFPPDSALNPAGQIWEYLVTSDHIRFKERLSKLEDQEDGSFLLNLAHGQQNPATLEVALVRCGESFLLLGTEEHRHDAHFQTEILTLTNELSMEIRETARKNRELQIANESIETLARTDTLTGMANRRMLEETLPRETARANRLHESLSVIFVDVDLFKPINDEFGHQAGDQILASLGKLLKSQVRPYCLAARFGGDEFVLLLPGTSKHDAIIVAERLLQMVAAMIVSESHRQITVSMGVTSYVAGETGDEMLARADEALYRAKEKGGDRVEMA